MKRLAVIDYGMGNLRSVAKAIEHVAPVDMEIVVTSDQSIVANSDHVVCPGQGAAKDCMSQLQTTGMDKAVLYATDQGTPFLGICMGLQVLLSSSEENGGISCLDVIPGIVREFSKDMMFEGEHLKIPHMGWNEVSQTAKHMLWNEIEDQSRFYFCHSYYVDPVDPELTSAKCHYGIDFTAAVARDNIFACQFHPEKSAHTGLQLLHNFCHWDGSVQ